MEIVDIFFELQQNLTECLTHDEGGSCEIYCWYNKSISSVYIGRGKSGRHIKHKKDLLSLALKSKGWYCAIIYGLSDDNAKALEALLIEKGESLMGLTPLGTYDLIPGKMINKKREYSQERLINECISCQWKSHWMPC